MTIEKYGYQAQNTLEHSTATPARITAVHRDRFEIVCDNGSGFARLKTGVYHTGGEPFPTVGDFVLLDYQQNGDSRIIKTLQRKSYFSRLDPSSSGHGEQAVAANFDYVFIVQSLNSNFNLHRLERYLAISWQSGAIPVVVLTKADTVSEHDTNITAVKNIATGVDVFAVSAKTGYGVDKLKAYLKQGVTIVLLGSSGVGKSTLVNVLADEEIMATNEVREKDSRGRHTTSHRQLLLLKNGAMIIDTPGMREIGIWDVSDGLDQSFSEIEELLGSCKFSDCNHKTEPGCAIKKAIQNGSLSQERWESYLKLKSESHFTNNKEGYMRKKQQIGKDIAKFQRQSKAPDYTNTPCNESFTCSVCGAMVTPEDAGSDHRNHCPHCLSSIHVDHMPGDRASLCKGIMDSIGVWVRKDKEWAIIHRCRSCGKLSSNRIAADDNTTALMSIALKPLATPPFPLWQLEQD